MTPPLSDDELRTLTSELAAHGGSVSELRLLAMVNAAKTALRLCVSAMQDIHIYGDGRLDDVTRREFRIAYDAAEKAGVT
jgi:hypothetical protein